MHLDDDQRAFARRLRRDQTEAEQRMWYRLRGRRLKGFRFRRQHPIGAYFADFACLEAMLVIELDGGQHALERNRLHDIVRSDVIVAHGFTVIRFWDGDVLCNTDGVLAAILDALLSRCPQPASVGPSPATSSRPHPRCARPLPPKRER